MGNLARNLTLYGVAPAALCGVTGCEKKTPAPPQYETYLLKGGSIPIYPTVQRAEKDQPRFRMSNRKTGHGARQRIEVLTKDHEPVIVDGKWARVATDNCIAAVIPSKDLDIAGTTDAMKSRPAHSGPDDAGLSATMCSVGFNDKASNAPIKTHPGDPALDWHSNEGSLKILGLIFAASALYCGWHAITGSLGHSRYPKPPSGRAGGTSAGISNDPHP